MMIQTKLRAALLVLAVLGGMGAGHAEKINFKGCYAAWENGRLTLGNTRFERAWVAGDAGLMPVSIMLKNPDTEWLADKARKTKAIGTLEVKCSTGRRSVVGAEGVRLEITATGKAPQKVLLWLFPDAAGVLEERLDAPGGGIVAAKEAVTSGIEVNSPLPPGAAGVVDAGMLTLAPLHLRITQVMLMDQTDMHNELVSEREWLLMSNEKTFDLQCCVLLAENVIDGCGLAFVKLALLPHARSDKTAIDFRVMPGTNSITPFSNGYPVAVLGYRGGRAGRIHALHAFQRSLREYRPGRDGLFLSNTWGDRSRDARINEAFLLKEVAAGAALGVDVVQIDAGWQKRRSANSSASHGKGASNGFWAADPNSCDVDPARFPHGLEPVIKAARDNRMRFGLWFGPDSSNDAANWQKDADRLLKYHQEMGVDYFKIDLMKTHNATSLRNQRAMFDRMLEGSNGSITFDLDVTADIRPGYFGLPDIGPLFVENRYTDSHLYWPHQTLRNLWKLAQVVDPLRLRMEVLNNTRNREKYPNDPLAPELYQPDTLFAITMMANPLGWFETSNLPPAYVASMSRLVEVWKRERQRMHCGAIVPVGGAPDGVMWTGFVSAAADGKGGYALLFRESNPQAGYCVALSADAGATSPPGVLVAGATRATVLGGRGTARLANGTLVVSVPEKLDFIWVKLE
jgi:alpha-galactosidase